MSRPPFPAVVEARAAMGSRFEIVLPGDDRVRLQAAAEEALDEIERVEAQLSIYDDRSELTGINLFAAAGPVRVEPRLFALLDLAISTSRATEGAFDPTAGPLIDAWGFRDGTGHLPDPKELEAALELVGAELVELDPKALTVRFLRPGMRLNLGAIGKGYALDRAVEALRYCGIASALLHGGTSTVYGLGAPPDSPNGWPILPRDPRPAVLSPAPELLRDRALSVSAPHGRAFMDGERLLGHVLDPRIGQPAETAQSALVIHPSATVSDALSTALLVLGEPGVALLESCSPPGQFRVWG
jgi:thiamine biosynthesis lipoprotein